MTGRDLVKVITFMTNIADAGELAAVREPFLEGARPGSTLLAVAALMRPEWLIEVEAVALKLADPEGWPVGSAGTVRMRHQPERLLHPVPQGISTDPLRSCDVKVTDRHAAAEYAAVLKDLPDVRFADARTI